MKYARYTFAAVLLTLSTMAIAQSDSMADMKSKTTPPDA